MNCSYCGALIGHFFNCTEPTTEVIAALHAKVARLEGALREVEGRLFDMRKPLANAWSGVHDSLAATEKHGITSEHHCCPVCGVVYANHGPPCILSTPTAESAKARGQEDDYDCRCTSNWRMNGWITTDCPVHAPESAIGVRDVQASWDRLRDRVKTELGEDLGAVRYVQCDRCGGVKPRELVDLHSASGINHCKSGCVAESGEGEG